jgi:phenylalanyl-tRNA synthetase alpha chain
MSHNWRDVLLPIWHHVDGDPPAPNPAWQVWEVSELPSPYRALLHEKAAEYPELRDLFTFAAGMTASATGPQDLQDRQKYFLGKKRGVLTSALVSLRNLDPHERRVQGSRINTAKAYVLSLEKLKREILEAEAEARSARLADVTVPGRRPWIGRAHVLAQIRDELLDLFHGLGYSVYTSPEVEVESYNFGKLNFAEDHPARDAHDTYFVSPGVVMRTHTSPGWVRAMEERQPPLRLVFPGRVFRAEQIDASHMDQFHQIDGLYVDRNVSMADLKSTLATFARSIYGAGVRTRFVPIYFPFVEPGAQLDVSCVICGGGGSVKDGAGEKRCSVCKGSGWLEVLGAGMVHPNVFRAVGYDPEAHTGFAFGMGLERIAMLRYGIPEIRLFLENDVRFLNQF